MRRTQRPAARLRGLVAAAAGLAIAPGLLVGAPSVAVTPEPPAAMAAGLATGFVDETIVTGLSSPTNIVYAPGGRVFVTEKRGVILTWPTYASFAADGPRTTTIDIRNDVMNFWDRGLLGIAVDPNYPASPYLYILYTYNAIPGGSPPRWTSADPDNDPCLADPGPTTDGCVVQNRLDRLTINTSTGVSTARTQLLLGWCQQFPSHSAGSLVFGADDKLYVSAGEGASFNIGSQDFGQKGGTKPNTSDPVTPKNPCGDPPAGVGGTMTPPTAEGGALRSQSFRRPASESALLNGTVLRLDTDGTAAAGNPAAGNTDPIRQRIVAYGMRNPYRITFRPGTNDLYIGDVGNQTWEEVNRLPNPTTGPTNYGWPCFEGPEEGTYYTTVSLNLCSSLSAGSVTAPLWYYAHEGHMATNDGCPPVAPATFYSASVTGLAFYTGSAYPSQFHNALFVADYSRNCIVYLPNGGGGVPTGPAVAFSSTAANPVALVSDPSGNLTYPDLLGGKIHRIRYQAPVAAFTATPSSGPAPLTVSFNASGSSAPAGIATYAWNFGDNTTGSGVTTSHTYAGGTFTARLTITDNNGSTATTTRTIASSNTAPVVTMDAPTCTTNCWQVGDTINLLAHATDPESGNLPPSAISWHVGLEHCHSPSDCHEHPILDKVGDDSASFTAPDHDSGSYLKITVTAKDSGGLTSSVTRNVHPEESAIRVVSSPAGLPVTLDGVSGNGSVGPVSMIVGHSATISAQPTVAVGEATWSFQSWSPAGGAASHTVTTPSTDTTYTATYQQTGSDASDTCSGAPVQAVSGSWVTGRFGKVNDVDWARFSVPTTGSYRFILGNLPVDGVMSLYSGCSTLISTVNQPGTRWEEMLTTLTPGTYALRFSSVGGVSSSSSHQWLAARLSGTVALLSAKPVPASGIRYVGDVYNTSTSTRSVTVTARLYSSSGALLGTVSTKPFLSNLAGHARSTFILKGTKPVGFHHAFFTVTSTAASSATRQLSTTVTSASSPSAGLWRVNGTVRNTGSTTATSAAYCVAIYDKRGSISSAIAGAPSATTLARNATATFSATFGISATPSGTVAKGRAS